MWYGRFMSWNLLVGSDFPKGAWVLDGNSPYPDISGYENPATATGTDRGPALVKGAARSLVVGNDAKVTFVNNFWKRNREYLAFSLEVFIRPVVTDYSNTAEIQILGHAGQMDGLTIQKGVVSFVTKYASTGEARASFDTMNHQTSHIVGLHTATKNSLYINGELVSEVDITPEQQADTYAVDGGNLVSGTTTGPNKFMLNAVALYEGVLDDESIDQHYAEAQDTLTAEAVAINYGGQLLEFAATGAYAPFFRIEYDTDVDWALGGRTNVGLLDGTLYPTIIGNTSINGWWESVIPLGTAPTSIQAVSILWEGSGVLVKTSRDGILWEAAEKGKPVTTVPAGTLPDGEFLYVRVEFEGNKVDDPGFMDNMSISLYLTDNAVKFSGRDIVLAGATPENDYDVNDLHQDWGAEMNNGSITIKSAPGLTGAAVRTVEVWVMRTGGTFTTSLTGAHIRTNGGTEQSTKLGEWQLRHFVFDDDFAGDIVLSGTAQIGHIIIYPATLSDETIAEIYSAYVGKPKVVLEVDENFDIHEFDGEVDIYEYDWALESAA